MTDARERRVVFGEVADAYEAARPGYPAQLVTDALEYAALDGAPVIEVGAGTGKASLPFAARQVALTCVEPDDRMATVLRHRLADYPNATIFHGGFEQWTGPAGQFGLLVSATAWHWVDPAVRWTKAVEVLRPGGAIALCWHVFRVVDPAAFAALRAAHERHDLAKLVFDHADAPQRYDDDLSDSWPMAELQADGRYVDVTARRYAVGNSFTADRYLDLMSSVSRYRMLPDEQRTALFDDVAAVITDLGGAIDLTIQTRLFLARSRS